MKKQKQQQQGFALVVALIFMIVLTMIGFGFASRGKLTTQIAKTSSRYQAVSAAAEDEMYRLLGLLSGNDSYIDEGDGQFCDDLPSGDSCEIGNPKILTQVWDGRILANKFGTTGIAIFNDFNHAAWEEGINNTVRSEYGTIRTRGFVQELISRRMPVGGEIVTQYLITVKAFGQNPGDPAPGQVGAIEREAIVIQSLAEIRFAG